MSIFRIGDVVQIYKAPYVLLDMKNYENAGSCSYDRKYLACSLDYIEKHAGSVTETDLDLHSLWISVKGLHFPDWKLISRDAFSIEKVECFKITKSAPQANVIKIVEYKEGTNPATVLLQCSLPEITFDSIKALCDAVKAFDFSIGVERVLCVNDRELNLINTTSDIETEWSYTTESKLNDWLDSINLALSKMSSF